MAIESNLRTFHWGRVAAHDLDAIKTVIDAVDTGATRFKAETLDDAINYRADFLKGYQNGRLAKRYRALVAFARKAEEKARPGSTALTQAVMRNYFKLLAYKDEYEVARLYTSGDFEKRISAQFEGDVRLKFHMSPPIFSRPDPLTGRPKKSEFGPWMFKGFKLLAKFKALRGTPFDPFGYADERKMERRLIKDYEA